MRYFCSFQHLLYAPFCSFGAYFSLINFFLAESETEINLYVVLLLIQEEKVQQVEVDANGLCCMQVFGLILSYYNLVIRLVSELNVRLLCIKKEGIFCKHSLASNTDGHRLIM
jgi:hypothetical protein